MVSNRLDILRSNLPSRRPRSKNFFVDEFNWKIERGKEASELINAYVTPHVLQAGQNIYFHLSAKHPGTLTTIRVFRLGNLGKHGEHQLYLSQRLLVPYSGVWTPSDGPSDNLARSLGASGPDWEALHHFTIPTNWTPGYYVARFETDEGRAVLFPFWVVSQQPNSKYLVISSTFTHQALNRWGNLYLHTRDLLLIWRRLFATLTVPFARPFHEDRGGEFLRYEYPFVRWIESKLERVDYLTDLNIHQNPSVLKEYDHIIVPGNSTHWTSRMFDAFEAALSSGACVTVLGANVCRFKVFLDETDGRYCLRLAGPLEQKLWARKTKTLFPCESSGIVSQLQPLRFANVGESFSHTGIKAGTIVPGLVGGQISRTTYPDNHPQLLSRSEVVTSDNQLSHCDVLYQSTPSGGHLFLAGTSLWTCCLDNINNQYGLREDSRVDAFTSKLLEIPFGPGRMETSVFSLEPRGSWGGWYSNQQVELGKNGELISLQSGSTPGVTRRDVAVTPNRSYELTTTCTFPSEHTKAFVRVLDGRSGTVLTPVKYFPTGTNESVLKLNFHTLPHTHAVDICVLFENAQVDERLVLHSLFLAEHAQPSAHSQRVCDQEIIASLASIPSRESALLDAISSLYPQVDLIRVFLNNYDKVPEFLGQDKIVVCRSQDYHDDGDAGKFFWVDDKLGGYRFICDDDLIYPVDYVDRMVAKMREYNNSVVVGVHGILLKQPLKEYYDNNFRQVTRFVVENANDRCVHILGTGTIAYYHSAIQLDRKHFQFRNMADIWFALQAQKQRVPMICIERPRNWLIQNRSSQNEASIYNHSKSKLGSTLDTSMIQNHVFQTNSPWTIHVPKTPMLEHLKLVIGITTYNRRDYLEACIESWLNTRNPKYDWVVIVADDGSEDDTHEFLEKLKIPAEVHILKNKRRYCVGQSNTIFNLCRGISFDYGFKADDDVVFLKAGWDDLYVNAISHSGYQHLCYLNYKHFIELRKRENPAFVEPEPVFDPSRSCVALSNVSQCMGAFFTFTPNVLERVGNADEENFPIRGQWHIDYSARCCRAGFNDFDHFYDTKDSNQFIELQNNLRKDYRCSVEWGDEYKKTKQPEEMERRRRLVFEASRLFYPPPSRQVSSPDRINQFFKKVFLLNLDRRPDRIKKVTRQLERFEIQFERFPAVDGFQEPHFSYWKKYFDSKLCLPPLNVRPVVSSKQYYLDYDSDVARIAYIEQALQRKAIQSAGAWGYLLTMIRLLEKCIKEQIDAILVLDDDVILHKDFNKLFRKFIRQIPENWKIIQLGTLQYHWQSDWITWHSENVYKCNGSSVASHAVGIHNSAFALLLNHCHHFTLPYDEGPLHKVKKLFKDECFTLYPNLIIQDTRESDIGSSNTQEREGRKKSNIYEWNLNDYLID